MCEVVKHTTPHLVPNGVKQLALLDEVLRHGRGLCEDLVDLTVVWEV